MPPLTAPATLSSLPLIRDYVLSKALDSHVPPTRPKIDLVLEEVIVNIANHAYGNQPGDIEVECCVSGTSFCCKIRDWGVEFNPLAAAHPDTKADIDHRSIGGLGLLFVTDMTDGCSYERMENMNELTLCFFF